MLYDLEIDYVRSFEAFLVMNIEGRVFWVVSIHPRWR
jgi:hypothetical protein